MSRTPLVSVVLPARNCGRRLREAVDSVLGQTFPDLELILVDDHSTDGSVAALGMRDARLRIVANPGAGLVDALNAGAARARGDYLARMDGDDLCLPHRLERQLQLLQRHPEVGVAGTRVEVIADGPVGEGWRRYAEWVNALVEPEEIERAIFIESPLPHPTVMMRRGVWQLLGGYRDRGWPEDYDLWLRAYRAGVRLGKVPEPLLRWRDSPTRLSRTDPRYSKRSFMRARAHFLVRTVLAERPALIWGAGETGTLLARCLDDEGVRVRGFIDVDPRKIGRRRSGRPVRGPEAALAAGEIVLVAVAAWGAREEIRAYLAGEGRREGRDFLIVS